MSAIRLRGATSGTTDVVAAAIAGDGVLTLPSGTGTLLKAEGGKILQIVRATDVTSRSTSSTSFVDVTGMSVTITPQVSTSIILVWAIFFGSGGGSVAGDRGKYQITLADNSTLSGAESSFLGSTAYIENIQSQISLLGRHAPASTAAITYKMRFGTTAGSATATIGNNTNTGQVYAIEVST
jgi:hypothetical protein